MRIAYVCTDPGVPIFGRKGGSTHVREIIRGFRSHGATVEIFARRIGGEPPPDLSEISVHRLAEVPSTKSGQRELGLLAANEDLCQSLGDAGRFDMVYERHALWSYAAMEYARDRAIPGLLEVNAPLVDEQLRFRRLAHENKARGVAARAFSAAGALLAVSTDLGGWLEHQPEAAGRVYIVPNGVDPARFDIAPPSDDTNAIVTIGFVGTLKAWHGVGSLVEAFATLIADGLNVRLLIVGDGPQRSELESQCVSLGLSDAVEFTGAVDGDRIPELLASMDIGVAPYPPIDGFYFSPLKLFEYMAAGCAIVASDVGQIAEVIEQDRTGILVQSGDTRALAGALERVATDYELRARLGVEARRAAIAEHRWDASAAKILEIARVISLSTLSEAAG